MNDHASPNAIPASPSPSDSRSITYRTSKVEGLDIFYREAGPRDAPTVLMLHGYPSSSRQWDTLIPLLADRWHIIAPDYPGFGQSDAPPADRFRYSFDHLAAIVEGLIGQLGLTRFVLLQQDYGGPIGMRLAVAHPERVAGIVVQNAVAHEDGLGPAWEPRKAYWRNRSLEETVIPGFTSLQGAKVRHVGSSPRPERYNPDTWLGEYALLSRPGQRQIQADLFFDYQTNVAAYPIWQAWLRNHRPPMLVLWGRYDLSFAIGGAEAYRRDVPAAEIHVLDAGHFALDEALDDCAALVRNFLGHLP